MLLLLVTEVVLLVLESSHLLVLVDLDLDLGLSVERDVSFLADAAVTGMNMVTCGCVIFAHEIIPLDILVLGLCRWDVS